MVYFGGTVFSLLLLHVLASSFELDITCTSNDMCAMNQYCSSTGICTCVPKAEKLGKHCLIPAKLGENCLTHYECRVTQRYSHCSPNKNVCECKPHTVLDVNTCKPTEDYEEQPAAERTIQRKHSEHTDDGGTLAMAIILTIIIVVLTLAAAYELTKMKKYIAKYQYQYKKSVETEYDEESEKQGVLDQPPEYHTVVQEDSKNGQLQ